jgi:hypothetical protein
VCSRVDHLLDDAKLHRGTCHNGGHGSRHPRNPRVVHPPSRKCSAGGARLLGRAAGGACPHSSMALRKFTHQRLNTPCGTDAGPLT